MTPLAVAIKNSGYKKQWIAEQVEISPSALAQLVSGKSEPNVRNALKLSRLLNQTVEDLWGHLVEGEGK